MAKNLPEEEIQRIVREKLNQDKVKLWLPPYSNDNGERGQIPEELVNKYSTELNLTADIIRETLENLRLHAVNKLTARHKFQQSGIAVLKVRLAGSVPDSSLSPTHCELETKLDISGIELKKLLSSNFNIECHYLKLISCGHVIDDDRPIMTQNIKHQSQVMVICLSQSEVEARRQEQEVLNVQKTRQAAEVLTRREDDGSALYLQIADHNGKPINLPVAERKSLALAMTLNEKGRAALKRKQYGGALLLLLEADKEFRQCRSDILNAVDNYAVLCLDITWCYLCLKNINDLPDADARLKTSEQCLKRSYGQNFERLNAVKGDNSRELALFVRLYLLQGVVAFYQTQRNEAWLLLEKAQSIWRVLQVDVDKLNQVVSMGFTEAEARLGLRAAHGNIQSAVIKITDKREERKKIRKKEAEEKRRKKLSRKLGKTGDGKWVNVDSYETLISMGFCKSASSAALRQANNDINVAIQTLQEHPELLSLPDVEPSENKIPITDELISGVTALGFEIDLARRALERHHGNVERAINELIANGGILPDIPVPSTSSNKAAETSMETEEEKAAVNELVPDITDYEEDYLDLTLDEEGNLIEEYKAMILSLQ